MTNKMEVIKEFKNQSINWIAFSVKVVLIFNIFGAFILILEKEKVTYEDIIIYTLVSILFSCFTYLKHIKKIILTDERLIISYNYKTVEDLIYNFSVKEKMKQRGLIKYYRLIVKNKKTKKTVRIDSNEWDNYRKIKEAFLRKGLLEN